MPLRKEGLRLLAKMCNSVPAKVLKEICEVQVGTQSVRPAFPVQLTEVVLSQLSYNVSRFSMHSLRCLPPPTPLPHLCHRRALKADWPCCSSSRLYCRSAQSALCTSWCGSECPTRSQSWPACMSGVVSQQTQWK